MPLACEMTAAAGESENSFAMATPALSEIENEFVNLNPVQGREQAGRRPVLVLSADAINRLPLVVTVVESC
jgi:hypothetical protein